MAKITISGVEDKKPTGTTGTNAGAGTSSVGNKVTVVETTSPKKYPSYLSGGSYVTNAAADAAANEERAETSIAELKNSYAKALRDEYNYSAEKLKNERNEALRENWVLQQQAEAALPEQMAAAGINGGASETSLAALRARYQGDRNSIRGDYNNNLGDLTQQIESERAQADRNINERWIEYLLSLAENSHASRFK